MSRVIKFRAWHKQEQKLYQVVGTFRNMVYLSPSEESLTVVDVVNVELMQFTGLTDKNGKDIYEGDIVDLTCLGYGGTYSKRVQVLWADFRWWFQTTQPDTRGRIEALWVESKWQSQCEVIGNIYEHPELLGGDKA